MGEILYQVLFCVVTLNSMSWRVSLLLEGSFGRCPATLSFCLITSLQVSPEVAQRTEYLALFASLTLVLLEGIIHLITLCLRKL